MSEVEVAISDNRMDELIARVRELNRQQVEPLAAGTVHPCGSISAMMCFGQR